MCGESDECVSFSGIFSGFNFRFGDVDISIKPNNTKIIDDGNPSILWHSMKNLVNFIRHITSIKVLCLCKLKPGQCSQLYSAIDINVLTLILLTWRIWWVPNNASKWQMEFNPAFKGLIAINFYRDQELFKNLNYILWNSFTLLLLLLTSRINLWPVNFLYKSHCNWRFVYVTNRINCQQEHLESRFPTKSIKFSSGCPFIGSPCWYSLWITTNAICVMN